MAELDQVTGERVGARLGVAAHVVHPARRAPVQHDHRDVVGAQQPQRRRGVLGGHQEDAVHLALHEQAQVARLLLVGFVGVAEHHGEAAGARCVLDAARDRREERVGDVRHDQGQHLRALRAQLAGERVGTYPSSAIASSTRCRVAALT